MAKPWGQGSSRVCLEAAHTSVFMFILAWLNIYLTYAWDGAIYLSTNKFMNVSLPGNCRRIKSWCSQVICNKCPRRICNISLMMQISQGFVLKWHPKCGNNEGVPIHQSASYHVWRKHHNTAPRYITTSQHHTTHALMMDIAYDNQYALILNGFAQPCSVLLCAKKGSSPFSVVKSCTQEVKGWGQHWLGWPLWHCCYHFSMVRLITMAPPSTWLESNRFGGPHPSLVGAPTCQG